MWGILTVAERRSLRMTMGKVGLLVIILNYNAQFPSLTVIQRSKNSPDYQVVVLRRGIPPRDREYLS